MAATLLTLRNRVKSLLNNDDFFTDANLDLHINTAYSFHHAIVSDALQNRLTITDFIDVVAGTREYDLSTVKTSGRIPDQIVSAKYKGNNSANIGYFDLDYLNGSDDHDLLTTGQPRTYALSGQNIILGIKPVDSLTDGLKIEFVPYPIDLAADGDLVENTFNGIGEKCIAQYAVILAKSQEESYDANSTALQGWVSTYEALVLRFKNNLEMRAFEQDEIKSFDSEFDDGY